MRVVRALRSNRRFQSEDSGGTPRLQSSEDCTVNFVSLFVSLATVGLPTRDDSGNLRTRPKPGN